MRVPEPLADRGKPMKEDEQAAETGKASILLLLLTDFFFKN